MPTELRSRPRWVRYSSRKVPLQISGEPASSTSPATWTSHRQATGSKVGVGIGFVLNGDGIICIDLDHCLVDGEPNEAARRLLAKLPTTYVEVSPSGDGLHVWGYADIDRGRRLSVDGLSVEVYGSGRYITVTGRRFESCSSRLADLKEVVAGLC